MNPSRFSIDTLRHALCCGLDWLGAAQDPDGSWPDFLVSPTTEGREWTTGYVGAHLSTVPLTREAPWASMLARSYAFLRRSRRLTGGWGFSSRTPVDADSTAWCLLSLLAAGDIALDEFGAERKELRRHQRPEDGGFGTYRRGNINLYPEDSGYYTSSPCVTAAAALALYRLGHPDDALLVRRAVDYLSTSQLPEEGWPSFWWERGIYSTAIVVRLLHAVGQERAELLTLSRWLERLQGVDGSWCGERSPEPSAFLTAVALATLLDLGVDAETGVVARGLAWLLDAQREDGSWDSPPIMKVPPPEQPWQPGAPPGGVVVHGHRRSFVTATVVSLLGRLVPSTKRRRLGLRPQPRLHDLALDDEVRTVLDAFERYLDVLPEHLRQLMRTTPLSNRRGAGLSHYLPFWLDATLASNRRRPEARQMALANRFGQFFCLLQDGVIDGDSEIPSTVLLPLNGLFFRFVHGYQTLFSAEHPFWSYFEAYWQEYLEALAWEKRRHSQLHPYEPSDFRWLGRKFSPVKICAAGMAFLAERLDVLPVLEEAIETLQAGYQLLDDLRDWHEDLERGCWTWPLTLARYHRPGSLSADEVERLLWREGLAIPVLERALEYFEASNRIVRQLKLQALSSWVHRLIDDAQAAIAAVQESRRRAPYDPPLLRVFGDDDGYLIFNIATGALYAVESALGSVSEQIASGTWRPTCDDDRAIMQELRDAEVFSTLPPPMKPAALDMTTLFLNATPLSRHRCYSCLGSSTPLLRKIMPLSAKIGERAIDALLGGSGSAPLVRLVFLNTGSRLAQGVVSHLMAYGYEQAAAAGKAVRCHLVVDTHAADVEGVAGFTAEGGYVRLCQDGVRHEMDIARLFDLAAHLHRAGVERFGVNLGLEDYRGSPVDLVASLHNAGFSPIGVQARKMRPAASESWSVATDAMKADFTALAEYFACTVEAGEMVPLIDVLRPLLQVYRRERIAAHCGAGMTMLAATPEGTLLPCFRFANEPALAVGHIDTGLDMEAMLPYRHATVDQREPCRSCWARYLCGGGCYDNHLRINGDIRRPDPGECELITNRFEVSIKLVVRLRAHLPELAARIDREELMTFLPSMDR